MSLYSALFSGVSGLNAYSSALGIISDNITNVNTVGYKASIAEFSTLVTETSSTTTYSPGGVAARPRSLISQQGLPTPTTSGTDLAIDGSGFFVVNSDPVSGSRGTVSFTRAGSFRPDDEGFLRNAAGQYLLGFPLGNNGELVNNGDVRSLEPISTTGLTGTAEPTTEVRLRANLQAKGFDGPEGTPVINPRAVDYDPSDPANNLASGGITPDFTRPIDVFDAQGGTHRLTFSFLQTDINEWAVEVYADPPSDVVTQNGFVDGQLATGTVRFNSDGSIDLDNTSPSLLDAIPVAWTNGAGSQDISFDLGSNGDVNGVTQFNSRSALISSTANGAAFGNVVGVSVGEDGTVTALFDNNLTRAVYRIPLGTFQNPDGLRRLQGNSYGISADSGTFSIVEPGTGGGGTIESSTLEASTVDLANEFTRLISTQRAFSASTRVITTADEMLAELNQV